MKTPEERGRYGRWLYASREARGYKTTVAARKAMAAAGIVIGHSAYAEYEAGTKTPSKNHLPELERFYGPVDAFEAARVEEGNDLTALIRAQTEAIDRQTDMLKAVLLALGTPQMSAETRAWVEQALAPIQSPLPTPDRPETTARP